MVVIAVGIYEYNDFYYKQRCFFAAQSRTCDSNSNLIPLEPLLIRLIKANFALGFFFFVFRGFSRS